MSDREIISVDAFIAEFCYAHRTYKSEGVWYVFRDKNVGDKRTQCQYGVLDKTKDDGSVVWEDCEEGSLFAEVKPFIDPECDRIAVRRSRPRRNVGVNEMQKWAFS